MTTTAPTDDPLDELERRVRVVQRRRVTDRLLAVAAGAASVAVAGMAQPWKQYVDADLVTTRSGLAAAPALAVLAAITVVTLVVAWFGALRVVCSVIGAIGSVGVALVGIGGLSGTTQGEEPTIVAGAAPWFAVFGGTVAAGLAVAAATLARHVDGSSPPLLSAEAEQVALGRLRGVDGPVPPTSPDR